MKKIISVFIFLLFFSAQSFGAEIFQSGKLFGLKNNKGKIVAKAQYQKIEQLKYTPVKTVLIPMQSTNPVKSVTTNFFKAQKNNKWGVLNEEGKNLSEFNYDDILVDEYGSIVLVKGNEKIMLNPVKSKFKKTSKTLEAVVGLPVTIVAGALMPVEVISKMGKK